MCRSSDGSRAVSVRAVRGVALHRSPHGTHTNPAHAAPTTTATVGGETLDTAAANMDTMAVPREVTRTGNSTEWAEQG